MDNKVLNNNYNEVSEQIEKYSALEELLEKYGDLRSVHKVESGFYISDLYLNGTGEMRLSCTDLITQEDFLVKSGEDNYEMIEDKEEILEYIESCIKLDIYEENDNTFSEHADYVLEYVDFSKLPTRNFYKGVMDFIEGKEKEVTGDFFFIGTNDIL